MPKSAAPYNEARTVVPAVLTVKGEVDESKLYTFKAGVAEVVSRITAHLLFLETAFFE